MNTIPAMNTTTSRPNSTPSNDSVDTQVVDDSVLESPGSVEICATKMIEKKHKYEADSTQFESDMSNFLLNEEIRLIKHQKKEEELEEEVEVVEFTGLTQVTTQQTTTSNCSSSTYSSTTTASNVVCGKCRYKQCHDERYGEYCVLGVYDFCHTSEDTYLSWYSARAAFRESYKQILRSTTFLDTRIYDSNPKRYDIPLCMVEGSMEKARVLFKHKSSLKAIEKRYRDGAVFLNRLLPIELEKKKNEMK